MASALTFLEHHHKDGNEFVSDETKEHSKQWMHTHSPNKSKKFKQISARKLMATVFWGSKRALMIELMQWGTTVTCISVL
jgi:hypothetical protein